VRRTIELEDPLVVRAVRAPMRADTPLQRLLVYRTVEGDWVEVRSDDVAGELGNTPTVARGSYVDPRVVEAYQNRMTIAPEIRRAQRHRSLTVRQGLIEKATARLINRVNKRR
jgi:DNA topoisomerase IB